MWTYICPLCKQEVAQEYDIETIKDYVGATHDCGNCSGLLMIEEDLTVSDFGAALVERYSEMGVDVSKETATGSFVEF